VDKIKIMEYIKLNNKLFWESIPPSSGIYFIYSLDDNGTPIESKRLLGTDKGGVLYIGKSNHLRERLRMLWRVLNPEYKTTAHTFGLKYNTYEILRKYFPRDKFAIKFEESKSPKDLEKKHLEDYLNTFGEVPPFNSSI